MLLQPGMAWEMNEQVEAENTAPPSTAAGDGHEPHPVTVHIPHVTRPSGPYTASEWRSLIVVLSSLPSTLRTLTITTELPSSSTLPSDTPDAYSYLSNVPDWHAITAALDRFTSLEKLVWLKRTTYGGICVDEEFGPAFQKLITDKLGLFSGVDKVLQYGRMSK